MPINLPDKHANEQQSTLALGDGDSFRRKLDNNRLDMDQEDAKSTQSRITLVSCQTNATHGCNTNKMIIYPQMPGQETFKMVLIPLEATSNESAGRLGEPIINYHAQIYVGTPMQKFKIQFELGLDNNFLPHYSRRPWRSSLHYNQGYRGSKSLTSSKGKNYYTMSYDNCEFLGKLHEDNFKFKSLTRVRKQNGEFKYNKSSLGVRINFLAIDMVNRKHLGRLPIDGMIGLGPKLESDSIGCKNLLIKLQEESLIDKLFVSMWFDTKNLRGQLLFGGYDPLRFKGPIYWHKSNRARWTINLTGLSIGTSNIEQALPGVAQLSSVINQIQAPISAMEQIYSYFKVHHDPKSGMVWVQSDNYAQLPDIHLHTDLVEITLEPTAYLGRLHNRHYLQIVPGSSDREWVLGTIFLENVYSIFNLTDHHIGLARKGSTPIENFKSHATTHHSCTTNPTLSTHINHYNQNDKNERMI